MSEKNLLSVIIPVHNPRNDFNNCIESVINSTYKNLEIIIIDDNSTEEIANLCDDYAKKYDNIICKHVCKGSAGGARNVGLELTHGEYLAFCDSDDFIEPTMYEKLLNNMAKYNADVAMCGHKKLFPDGSIKKIANCSLKEGIISPTDMLYSTTIWSERKFVGSFLWDKVYKRSVWGDLRFNETYNNGEDRLILFSLFSKKVSTSMLPEPLYNYYSCIGISRPGNNIQDNDFEVGVIMLESSQNIPVDLTPFEESYITNVLGRIKRTFPNNDKNKYLETVESFNEHYNIIKCIFKKKDISIKYKILCFSLHHFPKLIWNIGKITLTIFR